VWQRSFISMRSAADALIRRRELVRLFLQHRDLIEPRAFSPQRGDRAFDAQVRARLQLIRCVVERFERVDGLAVGED